MRKPPIVGVVFLSAALGAARLFAQEDQIQSRGFSPEKVYDVGEVDSVNLFTGTLTLTLPIGSTYQVGGDLSYGLTLVYSSLVWDVEKAVVDLEEVTRPVPSAISNAGLGWTLTLGMLFPPESGPENDTEQWMYVTPDGAKHHFYDELHEGQTDGSAATLYTRDNSYLRLKLDNATNPSTATIERPDNTIHRFEESFSAWQLKRIEDRWGNFLDIDRTDPFAWDLIDRHGRVHTIRFAADAAIGLRVTQVELEAFSGQTAIYAFTYESDFVELCYRDTDLTNPNTILAPLLTRLTLPDGSTYELLDDLGSAAYHRDCDNDAVAGAATRLELPTLGTIEWTWGDYYLPSFARGKLALDAGVRERTTTDPYTGLTATWFYGNDLFPPPPYTEFEWPEETRTYVVQPTGDCTAHYFGADPVGLTGFRWAYGLPFSPAVTDPADPAFHLSTEVWTGSTPDGGFGGDVRTCSQTKLRSTSVLYEHDTLPAVIGEEGEHLRNTNRRLRDTRVVYHDDGNRFAKTVSSDFDGLGHYRQTDTDGDFAAGNVRSTFTDFNPDRGTYPGSFTPLPVAADWITETFDAQSVTENGVTAREEFCFKDPSGPLTERTSFLYRRRTLNGAGRTASDLVAEFVPGTFGNLVREVYYGGDVQAVGTGGLCALALPATNQYRIRHTYDVGVLETTSYRENGGASVGFRVVDRTIDADTGLVATSRDTAQLLTSFEYDTMGRLTFSKPEAGQGAWTEYRYTPAGGAAPARIEVFQRPNGGGAALATSEIEFDGFGRVFREKRKLPSGAFNVRETRYNSRGWKEKVSEVELAPPTHFTEFKAYDPFGRPQTITPPDGPTHDVTLVYTGVSRVERTVRIETEVGVETPVTTTEVYDRQGRLHQVIEPGPAGTDITTTYAFDEGNRLTSVDMAATVDGAPVVQQRLFDYDRRGFLGFEQHPEKGASGNGKVEYEAFDARGHAGRKRDGPNEVTFAYDRAERLVEVREGSGLLRPLKTFAYGTSGQNNPPLDWVQGKLRTATRFNYLPAPVGTVEIAEVYTYGGTGGRVSGRKTRRNAADWFDQGFSWTELGDLAQVVYPSCVHAGCSGAAIPGRTVNLGYSQGFLASVGGYAPSIGYHPNEMLAEIVHASGVKTVWDPDPDGMRRPGRISTQGVVGGAPFDTGAYAYDGAGNITAMGPDSFTYDALGRLRSGTAQAGALVQSQGYDPFGNRVEVTTRFALDDVRVRSVPADPATNRFLGTPERGASYDAAGNLTAWGDTVFTYDPLDRLARQVNPAGATTRDRIYVYTADDERLAVVEAESSPPATTWTVRDLAGNVLRELREDGSGWSWKKDTVYRGSQVLALEEPTGVRHAHLDHLGSVRMLTRGDGTISARHDFFGFGEEAPAVLDREVRFAGHERRDELGVSGSGCQEFVSIENETLTGTQERVACTELSAGPAVEVASGADVTFRSGDRVVLADGFTVAAAATWAAVLDAELQGVREDLDYMHARYCSPWLGRFLSVDEIGTGTRASQSWNRYLYAYGNPLRLVDPDGLAAREYGSRCGSDRNCQLLAAIARDTAPAARAMEFGVRSTVKAGTALLLAETGAPAAAIVMSTIIQNVPEAQRLTGFLRGELRGAIGQMINTAFARGALDARQLLDSQIATGQVVIVSGFSDFVIPEDIHIDEKVEVIAPDPGSVITREELDLLLELNEFSNFSCFVTGACRP